MENSAKKIINSISINNAPILNNNENPNIKHREFSINSETIASYMIDKLISLSITGAVKNEIENRIPEKCIDYISNIINNFIKVEFLPYDRDDKFLQFQSKKPSNNIQNDFLTRTLSNDDISKGLDITSSMEDDSYYNKNNIEQDFLKTQENNNYNSNNNYQQNNSGFEDSSYFFDNNYCGINDWTICSEPVI